VCWAVVIKKCCGTGLTESMSSQICSFGQLPSSVTDFGFSFMVTM